jgi:hypothetical protein
VPWEEEEDVYIIMVNSDFSVVQMSVICVICEEENDKLPSYVMVEV